MLTTISLIVLAIGFVAVCAFAFPPPGGWRAWWDRRPRLSDSQHEPIVLDDGRAQHQGSECFVTVGDPILPGDFAYASGWDACVKGDPRECPGYDAPDDDEQWYDGYDDALQEWRKGE